MLYFSSIFIYGIIQSAREQADIGLYFSSIFIYGIITGVVEFISNMLYFSSIFIYGIIEMQKSPQNQYLWAFSFLFFI